ncbi:MAG: SRPBCC family protein [Acidobacteria bacterium]|nr:SRPBCC family protein [Acidobacteriota bacterium]
MGSTTIKKGRNPDRSYFTVDELYIDAPPDRLYRLLMDFNRRHEWTPTVQARVLSAGEVRVNSEIEMSVAGKMGASFAMRIRYLEPPYRIGCELIRGDLLGLMEWEIAPHLQGSLVKLKWKRMVPNRRLFNILFALTGTYFHSRQSARTLFALKRRAETRHAAP